MHIPSSYDSLTDVPTIKNMIISTNTALQRDLARRGAAEDKHGGPPLGPPEGLLEGRGVARTLYDHLGYSARYRCGFQASLFSSPGSLTSSTAALLSRTEKPDTAPRLLRAGV